jgi:hypothetical protein
MMNQRNARARVNFRLLAVAWLALAACTAALAQTGTLRGQAKDDSGAMVPSATVQVTGADGQARSTTTDGRGGYTFNGLPLGTYSVTASAPKLTLADPVSVTIKPGSQSLDIRLTVEKSSSK